MKAYGIKNNYDKIHQKLGFTDTVLVENLDLAEKTATKALRCLVLAETSI